MKYSININGNEQIAFNNNVNYCVGTGRMGLALTKEYFDQLKVVQKDIGFKFIRGHGLFCDDMGIYQEFIDTADTMLALTKKKAWIASVFPQGSIRDKKEKEVDLTVKQLLDDVKLTIQELTM